MSLKTKINESKANIGWIHGILSTFGGVICAYLLMLNITNFIDADYAIKLIPSMILTPIMSTVFGMWILFSQTILVAIKKTFLLSTFLLVLLYIGKII